MASKTLRLPQGNEWKKLPRSKAQAIDKGLNRFIGKDGQLREIRRFGSSRYPQGVVERWSSRNQNRGGGTGGTRQVNEKLATPPWADKNEFGQAMSKANAMGLDGDHIREISRTAEGIRWLESTGRGTAEQMFASYEAAGLPLGNQAGNVQPLDPVLNQQVKPAELRAMDEGIARAGQQTDKIFGELGSIKFRRGLATSLAASGAALVGPLGTAASAAETAERTRIADETGDIVDRVQAGISGFSLAADAVSYAPIATIPATIASTGADVLNMGIDTVRGMITFGKR